MKLRAKLLELGILKDSIHLDIVGIVPISQIPQYWLIPSDPEEKNRFYFETERNHVDIPLGTHFDIIFDMDDPLICSIQDVEIVNIAMRARPNLPLISHGCAVLARFEFETAPPAFLLEQMAEPPTAPGKPRRKGRSIVFSSMDFYKKVLTVFENWNEELS